MPRRNRNVRERRIHREYRPLTNQPDWWNSEEWAEMAIAILTAEPVGIGTAGILIGGK